ncbi:unnamed protein product [Heligmosomoides polygyrus]|uniref:BESS domain-containing protein n=1 Tax=Heligmosomoides polygyrus TaxID=6339 RepID=A0A183F9B2_HELPZ|nr:unnamed protein product [Heligmosomoides polygyrus]
MKRAKPDPDRSQKAEGWPYWKALQFLDPILDTGERYVSTPSMSQSSHFSDHTLEDITDYDENVAPESAGTQHVSVLGSRPRPKRRSSGKSAVEQLASFVKALPPFQSKPFLNILTSVTPHLMTFLQLGVS